MATGRMASPGKSAAVIHDAILNRTPVPVTQLNPEVPPKLQEVIAKALEKDRKLRYQSAADLRTDLQRLKGETDSAITSPATAAVVTVGERRGIRWKVMIPAALVAAALAGGGYFYIHRTPKLTDKDTIVLADFTNTTGDPVFDGALRQGLSVQLEQSPFLSIISDQKVRQTLKLMGQAPDANLTPSIARELCQRTGSAAVLNGSIVQIGTQYLLTLKAMNCESGESLASAEAQAADKNHVLDALGKTTSEIRNKLGESLSTVRAYNTPLMDATTPSLDALNAYTVGLQKGKSNDAAAVPFFKRAIELDPEFASAYSGLGTAYLNLGESGLARENLTKAFALHDHVSETRKISDCSPLLQSRHWGTAEGHRDLSAMDPSLSSRCRSPGEFGNALWCVGPV